ncbi:MAG: hypothetical protein OER88_07585 [Planctomycetota bacterium]|nr:hypothetical protein [Planctomycetota bacterium]
MDKDLVIRMLHVLGGLVVAAIPIALAFSGWASSTEEKRETIAKPLRRWVGIASGFAGATGVYLMLLSLPDAATVPGWHALFGVKLLMALFLMFLASAIVGRSPSFAFFRSAAGLKMSALVAFVVVLIALYLGHGG